jgi:hypothetical protein
MAGDFRAARGNRTGLLVAIAALAIGLIVVGIGIRLTGGRATPGAATSASHSTVSGSPTPSGPAGCGDWDCPQAARFTAAQSMLASVQGHIGIVVRDRVTGAVWQAGEPEFRIWAGSTPKLAFTVALLEEDRAGQIHLDPTAHNEIAAMLSVSDNTAADTLWDRYARADPNTWMTRWQRLYGMSTASYVSGFPSRWGFVKCTPVDLASLMSYILNILDATDRAYLVHAMQTVGDVQHWGVWGAGPAMQPGVKDGWSIEKDDGKDHWITATVGFAGPDQRYIVAAMYHQFPGGDSIDRGVHTLTDLIATVFGAPVPAPVVIPPNY